MGARDSPELPLTHGGDSPVVLFTGVSDVAGRWSWGRGTVPSLLSRMGDSPVVIFTSVSDVAGRRSCGRGTVPFAPIDRYRTSKYNYT